MELLEFNFAGGVVAYQFEPLHWAFVAELNDGERADWYASRQYSKYYKDDIDYLREQHPEVAHWDDLVLVGAWEKFCGDVYYAKFLTPIRDYLFLAWLYDICEKYKQQNSNKETLRDFNNSELIEAAN